jgi:hypothetical protein
LGSSVSGTGSPTAPTNAGIYTVVAAFTSSDLNYGNSQSRPITFTISQALPTVTVTDAGGAYSGQPFPANATVKGIGEGSVNGTFTYIYYVGGSVNGTGTSIAPSNAGTYTIVAVFTSTDHNYSNAQSSPVSFTISPAAPATNHFQVVAQATATAGTLISFTVTALDQFNNPTGRGYSGTVHFSSTDGSASLPQDTTLINGKGIFFCHAHHSRYSDTLPKRHDQLRRHWNKQSHCCRRYSNSIRH